MTASHHRSFTVQRIERRIKWPSSHLVIIGLLLYIAAFQAVVYTSHRQSNSQLSGYEKESAVSEYLQESRTSSTSRLPINKTSEVVKVLPFHVLPWTRQSEVKLDIAYPIFVTGLPKTGTTSVFKFFRCGGVRSSHTWVTKPGEEKPTLAGECIQANILKGNPPFEGCGTYDLFSDTGVSYQSCSSYWRLFVTALNLVFLSIFQYIHYDHDVGLNCFYPSVDGLDAIYNAYPNATFVNPVRKTSDWYESFKAWAEGSLFVRFRMCNGTNFPNGQSKREDIYRFYDWHNEMIRNFCKERPSLTYLELELAAEDTGEMLEERTGINATCWKKCLPNKRRCEESR